MNLDSNVDFGNIAVETEGFTGADLQSILYSAQLSAVEEQQSQIQGKTPIKTYYSLVEREKHAYQNT